MELFDTTQLGLERALAGTSRRQVAIASNIANVSTPGYQRKDVDFQSELQAAWDGGRSAVESVDLSTRSGSIGTLRVDGNGVDIDTEAAEQAKNGLTSEAVSAALKTRVEILQIAMGVR